MQDVRTVFFEESDAFREREKRLLVIDFFEFFGCDVCRKVPVVHLIAAHLATSKFERCVVYYRNVAAGSTLAAWQKAGHNEKWH